MKRPEHPSDLKAARQIADNVRSLRKKAGWTQAELAEKAGIPDKVVGFVEQAATFPSLRTLCRIATAFKVTLSRLVQGV